ncbi:GTPase [Corynebacterium qintianiae]|uniref:GTPase n=1 Tax=Corynebacterium qintianiae TaxID=2709392 RepID=UPI001F22D2EF|nr:GTPase [Corynebacterium qintianiae]
MALFKKKPSLGGRLAVLQEAAELGAAYLSPGELQRLTAVSDSAAQRRALSAEHTVVGFFGATGSGKTSLFNAVVGEDLGAAAARRPTTTSPLAAVWNPEGSEELLDWLEVEDRRNRPGDFASGAGPLILLDLPDFDSVQESHRAIATRLAGQVDVLVWVSDPEKYADSVIHEHFIRPHANHSAVTLAVLNKADNLAEADRPVVAQSFAGLLRDDGLRNVQVIPTSARTGYGVDELRGAIARVAQAHTAQTARIEADLEAVTAPWAGQSAPRGVDKRAKREMDAVLVHAAGAERLAAATAAAYRKRLHQRTGWLLTSWVSRLRPDPLRRMGLREEADEVGVHRTSLPELDAASRATANQGVRGYAAAAAAGLPQAWASAVTDRAENIAEQLPAELDRAASRTRLPAQPSKAWGLATVLQWLALVAALIGVLWYLAAAMLPGALLPLMNTLGYGRTLVPQIEGWPIPTLLIMGGLLFGLVVGLVTGVFGGAIGAGIRTRTRAALRREIEATSAEHVVEPLSEVREDYAEFLGAVSAAAGR